MLGTLLSAPILVAPTAPRTLAHPDGEAATARGASDAGSLLVLSARPGVAPAAAVASEAGPWWYQTYVLRNRDATVEQVRHAAATGAGALVLTVDAPYVCPRAGVTEPLPVTDPRAGTVTPGHRATAWEQDPTLGPDAIGWLGSVSGLPVLVKGVLHPEDATSGVAAGAAGVSSPTTAAGNWTGRSRRHTRSDRSSRRSVAGCPYCSTAGCAAAWTSWWRSPWAPAPSSSAGRCCGRWRWTAPPG